MKKPASNQEDEPVSRIRNSAASPASKIDFSHIEGFSASEFHNQLHLLDVRVIHMLVRLRGKIGRIRISPAPGAVARASGSKTTMHYAEPESGILSEAIDIMPIDVDLETAYQAAMQDPAIGAVGVYPDWLPLPGLHVDLRPRIGSRIAQWSGLKVDGKQVYRSVQEAFV